MNFAVRQSGFPKQVLAFSRVSVARASGVISRAAARAFPMEERLAGWF